MPRRQLMQKKKARRNLNFMQMSRLTRAREHTFSVIAGFKYGYRNKEDISNLPPNVLVVGSQNVLTNAADRVAVRQGYTLDGPAGTQTSGIDSAYDLETHSGFIRNLRKWIGTLEVRYVNPVTNAVSWISLLTSLTSTKVVNFTSFWDFNTELKTFCLFVNGGTSVYEWTGAVGSFASATANTIVLSDAKTISQIGFYDNVGDSAKFIITIDGVDYTYTGVSGSTFTGVTPDPTGAGIAVGDAVIQKVATIAVSTFTAGPPTTYNADLISTLRNQVFLASLTDRSVYISKVNNYKDFSYTAAQRIVGEGALVTLDATPTALIPQEDGMYVSAGKDQWYRTKFTLDSTNKNEAIQINRLKTTSLQAAQTQALTGKLKNSIIFVSNEPIFNSIGPIKNVLSDPQVMNMSDSIKYDMDAYTFTDGSIYYNNYFIYLAVPKNGVVRMYNVRKKYWEAPQVLPVSRFYTVGGKTYGHSYLTNESYQMFTGYNDNGNPINAIAAFAYNNMSGGKMADLRAIKKNFNKFYTEGYISQNAHLMLTLNIDFGGFTSVVQDTIMANDGKIIFNLIGDSSLGKQPLGQFPIGTIFNPPISNILKFRKVSTTLRQNFYEFQPVYSSNDVDFQWELIAFGPALGPATELPVEITE